MPSDRPASNCPSPQTWQRFADGQLPAHSEAELAFHLDTCKTCAEHLGRLTSRWDAASGLLTPSPVAELRPETVARLGNLARTIAPAEREGLAGSGTGLGLRSGMELPLLPGLIDLVEVGHGGMGVVYQGREVDLNRLVAVKVLTAAGQFSPTARARAQQEAALLARLNHANVVQIYRSGEVRGLPFLVMEWISGGSLQQRLDAGVLEPTEAARIVKDLANAVSEVHAAGIVHRDLKPANVLLELGGQRPVAKLADFGLARPDGTESGLTESGQVLGTAGYLAPEQTGLGSGLAAVGPATDIHGLGGILYALLTGKPPYEGNTHWESLLLTTGGRHQPLASSGRKIPRDLAIIAEKCLQFNPQRRYRSANELADELDRFLTGNPIHARATSAPERLWKWARRHPVAAASLMLLTLAGVAGMAGTAYHIRAMGHALAAQTLASQKLAEANTDLAEQRQLALQGEQQAINAVKSFRDTIINEPQLKNTPVLIELRKRLLKEPLAFFSVLHERLAANRNSGPESLLQLAAASDELSSLIHEVGDKKDALSAYSESLSIRQELAKSKPSSLADQKSIAKTQMAIGQLQGDTGKPLEAIASFQAALATYQTLANANLSHPEFLSDVGSSYNSLGMLLGTIGRPTDAFQALEHALAIQQKQVDANPETDFFQTELAKTRVNLGNLLRTTGKPAEALKAFKQAFSTYERLAKANPFVVDLQRNLATCLNNIGLLLNTTGKQAEAFEAHQEALAVRRKLAELNPSVAQLQSDLATSYHNLGTLHAEAGKPAEAMQDYNQAIEIRSRLAKVSPSDNQIQAELGVSYFDIGQLFRNTGKPAEAMQAYQASLAIDQALARANPSVPQFQLNLATCQQNISNLLSENGQPYEAIVACKAALEILQPLAESDPSDIRIQSNLASGFNNLARLFGSAGKPAEALQAFTAALATRRTLAEMDPNNVKFQYDLASSYNNLGIFFDDSGKRTEAEQEYQLALTIQQTLAEKFPKVPDFASMVGGTLNNLAGLDLQAQQFEPARDKLWQAVNWQRKALAVNPRNPTYRQFMASHQENLAAAAKGLRDTEGAAEAEKERTTFLGPHPDH